MVEEFYIVLVEKLYTTLSEFETYLDSGLRIFGLYSIVNRSELYKNFRMICDLLPEKSKNIEDSIRRANADIYMLLDKLSHILVQSMAIGNFIIVDRLKISEMLDSIYTALSISAVSIPEFLQKKD